MLHQIKPVHYKAKKEWATWENGLQYFRYKNWFDFSLHEKLTCYKVYFVFRTEIRQPLLSSMRASSCLVPAHDQKFASKSKSATFIRFFSESSHLLLLYHRLSQICSHLFQSNLYKLYQIKISAAKICFEKEKMEHRSTATDMIARFLPNKSSKSLFGLFLQDIKMCARGTCK